MSVLTAKPSSEPGANFEYLSHRPVVIGGKGGAASKGASNGFVEYRFTHADILALPRVVGSKSAALAELLPAIQCLGRRPAGSFRNLSELYTSLVPPTAAGPSTQAIGVLRNFFLDVVDRRLQSLYRQYFAAHPPPARALHDQKVAALEAVRADAQDIVGSYDWHWLADWLELERIGETAGSCVRRLSNLAFDVNRVNFRFTYHCNIACRHCYNSSGPHLKAQRIRLEPMLAIVAQMPGVGIGHLNLTGGEPFLYPDHLTALIAAGRAAGLHGISINTNGYWAVNAEHARRTLERLSAAGFMQGPADHLQVSAGVYHQEFVEFACVLTLARSYHAMFGKPLVVDFERAPAGADVTERVRQEVRDAGLADRIDLHFRHVAPLGRGKELDGIAMRPIRTSCDSIDQIAFDPDGAVRPCCGLNNENHGVIVGKLKDHSLMDLVKHMQNDPILQFLAGNSMDKIFDYLDKPKNPNGYSATCHLCQDALGDLHDKEQLHGKLFSCQKFYPFWFRLPEQDGAIFFTTDGASRGFD